MKPREVVTAIGVVLGAAGLMVSFASVVDREREEMDAWSRPRTLAEAAAGEARLVLDAVDVRAGDAAVFEVCFAERLEAERWEPARLALAVLAVEGEERAAVVQTTVDGQLLASHATRRNATWTCIVAADARALAASGRLEVAVTWPPHSPPPETLRAVALRSHVVTRRLVQPWELWPMALLGMGVFLGLGAAAAPHAASARDAETASAAVAWWRPAVGVLTSWLVGGAFGLWFGGGPARVLLGSWASRLFDVGLAFALMPRTAPREPTCEGEAARSPAADGAAHPPAMGTPARRAHALGLRPARRRPTLALASAPLVGAGVAVMGGVVSSLVRMVAPAATRLSAVETFVAWPSGTLAVTANAVIAPVAEEIFYRGFVLGALEGRVGKAGAVLVSTVLFVVPHLPQAWGAWGNLAAIALSGLCFGALRAVTGSTAIAGIAHLSHNALLAVLDAAAAG
jgi:membrane protease YdiL (CAAX protease family)